MTKFRRFRSLATFLKKNLPVEYPVNVRRLPTASTVYGDCDFDGERFMIRINRKTNEDCAIDTLIHEAAHSISFFSTNGDTHGRNFGIAYARAYKLYLDWLETE